MKQDLTGILIYGLQGITGIILFFGLFVPPKRPLTEKEINEDLRTKLKAQRGMTKEAQAAIANLSAAFDAQAKEHQREIHLQKEEHKKEMEEERRGRPPIKMP